MLFHAESSCSWRSKCGRYQIVNHRAGFEIEVFRVNLDGQRVSDQLTLSQAQEWCRNHAHIPETQFAGSFDANGSPV